jgi:prophage tail gpP-like protein
VGPGVDPSIKVTEKMDMGDAVLDAVRPYGITSLFGDSNLTRNIRTGARPFDGSAPRDIRDVKLEDFSPSIGQGVFEYIEKIVAHQGFTIQPLERKSLNIVAPEYRQAPMGKLIRSLDGERTNVLSGRAVRDWTDVPTLTIATGRAGKGGKGLVNVLNEVPTFGENSPSKLAAKNHEIQITITDEATGLFNIVEKRPTKNGPEVIYAHDYPLYRPLYYTDKDSRNQEQIDRGARREISQRLKNVFVYHATVRGHRVPESEAFFAVDTVLSVSDEIEDVEEDLWVLSRRFYNDGTGPKTDLELIKKEAITL